MTSECPDSITPAESDVKQQTSAIKGSVRVTSTLSGIEGLGREDRRRLGRALRRVSSKEYRPFSQTHLLEGIEQLIYGEDLEICRQELRSYELSKKSMCLMAERYFLFREVGIPDSEIRDFYLRIVRNETAEGDQLRLFVMADRLKVNKNRGRLNVLVKKETKFRKECNYTFMGDNDAMQIFRSLLGNNEVKTTDIFGEILDHKQANIDLIKMQIEYLEKQQREAAVALEATVSNQEQPVEEKPVNGTKPKINSSEQAVLEKVRLFWTENPWSQEQQYLSPISTESWEQALEDFSKVSKGEISIKKSSILRALAFHLGKDVIKKALAARNKYGPEGIREWVKIKRGKDRIFLSVPQEGTAIFFVAGRDVAYQL